VVSFAIELEEAQAQLEHLIQQVHGGMEVLITRGGAPIARLIAADGEGGSDRVPGSAKGLFTVPDDFDEPLEDFREYM
jgi:prevent-host-death family protein